MNVKIHRHIAAAKRMKDAGSHNGDVSGSVTQFIYPRTRKLAAAGVRLLAVEGAKKRLAELKRECQVLEIFIQGVK
jgi:hypothetical protein